MSLFGLRTQARPDGEKQEFPRMRRSILGSIVRQSLVVSAITIVLLSVLSFTLARSLTAEQRLYEQLSLIATERKNILEDAVGEARTHAALAARAVDGHGPKEITNARVRKAFESLEAGTLDPTGITVFDKARAVIASTGERAPSYFASNADATFVVPDIESKSGVRALTAYAPLRDENGVTWGTLAVRYSASRVMDRVFADLGSSVGSTAEIVLAREQGGEIFIVHHSKNSQALLSYPLGSIDDPYIAGSPIVLATSGREGVTMTQDDEGRRVFVSFRYLQTLGWGMTVQVQSTEALAGVTLLALSLVGISVLLLVLAGMFGFFAARRLTEPLLHLAAKIRVLRPGHWTFRRSVRTGDEVELLDQVIADLTSRLQASYEKLEGQVADRTEALNKEVTLDRAILESIEYGVITTDAQGSITDVNSAASRLLGFRREELLDKEAVSVVRLQYQRGPFTTENHPVLLCLRERSIFRAPPAMHLCILRKDQALLPVMLMVTPLIQETKLLGAIIVFLDVTEERQTDYMKSEFISLASHQLRTPLSSMRWYMELLSAEDSSNFTDEQKSYLNEVQKASLQMAHLLDTLLRVARLDDGAMVIERKKLDVVELTTRLFEEVQGTTHNDHITFRADLPKEQIMISTDPVLMPIVLQNLVTNAMKYSPTGGEIAIRIRQDKNEVFIDVEDHGLGVPADEQPRVFEKFFRAKNTRHMMTTGTGLGLYLSKRIMESLGGKLTFRSEEGKGTIFTASLPKA